MPPLHADAAITMPALIFLRDAPVYAASRLALHAARCCSRDAYALMLLLR